MCGTEEVNTLQQQQQPLGMEDADQGNEEKQALPLSSSSSTDRSSSSRSPHSSSDLEELQRMPLVPPRWKNRKRLTKQLSMCETPRDIAWEKRRRQILRKSGLGDITDEDLNELKGSIELGFGFKEEDGQKLCNTLPALDLYFAVNRQLSLSPVSTPQSQGLSSPTSPGGRSSSFDSPTSDPDAWKICNPGDDPQHVKTKLRHWAQAVACSLMQSS
ncbi:hypothetical protein ACJRO7_032770 [Eucalyptus globulus]|uniref:Uncharacterized protein n=1 Tax=Eucalyptus globulus TaxID=34317 RepID=A0ABD3JLZ1_EUCGL